MKNIEQFTWAFIGGDLSGAFLQFAFLFQDHLGGGLLSLRPSLLRQPCHHPTHGRCRKTLSVIYACVFGRNKRARMRLNFFFFAFSGHGFQLSCDRSLALRSLSGIYNKKLFWLWRHYQGILKGEVSLYHWPPVWRVWNQLYDNWQFLFLFAKQTNPTQSNRRSTVQWYFPL